VTRKRRNKSLTGGIKVFYGERRFFVIDLYGDVAAAEVEASVDLGTFVLDVGISEECTTPEFLV